MSRGAGGSGRRGPLPALAELDDLASDLAIRIWTIAAIRRVGARRMVFINTKTITRAQVRADSTWERREISNRKREFDASELCTYRQFLDLESTRHVQDIGVLLSLLHVLHHFRHVGLKFGG